MRYVVGIIVSALMLTSPVISQSAQKNSKDSGDAIIIELEGIAWIRKGPHDEQPQRLKREKDVGRPLRAEEELRCESGHLKIKLWGSKEKTITPEHGWYPIPHPRNPNRVGSNLREAFPGLGGRSQRGASGIIFSPRRGGATIPATLVFRWTPFKEKSLLLLSLKRVSEDKPFWSEAGIDSAAGQFTSGEARRLLKNIQGKNPNTAIEFALVPPTGKPFKVVFRVLSKNGEKALMRELAIGDQQQGLMRTIRRAYAFRRRQLYNEAADEYEAVLADSPKNYYLLRATIRAQCRAGNKRRADDLAKRIPTGSPGVSCV